MLRSIDHVFHQDCTAEDHNRRIHLIFSSKLHLRKKTPLRHGSYLCCISANCPLADHANWVQKLRLSFKSEIMRGHSSAAHKIRTSLILDNMDTSARLGPEIHCRQGRPRGRAVELPCARHLVHCSPVFGKIMMLFVT